jgi:hypothetical protein
VFDPQTGKINTRLTSIAGKAFDAATPSQRKAWHRVTCMQSQDLIDVTLAKQIVAEMQREMDE